MPIQIIERQQRDGSNWMRCLITAGTSVHLTQKAGDQNTAYDMRNQWQQGAVLSPGPDLYDHSYTGVGGSWWVNEGGQSNLYVWYHGEDQDPLLPPLAGSVPGFYSSICAAKSTNGGASFIKLGQCLTSAPKNISPSAPGDQGDGEASVTLDKTGQYLFCYYNDHYGKQVGRGVQICLARSPISSNGLPGSWRKYYNGSFQTKGLNGYIVTPVLASAYGKDALFPMVRWNTTLNMYVMVYCENVWTEFTSPGSAVNSGIYIAYSNDGITWTGRERLVRELTIPWTGKRIALHPMLDLPENSSSVAGMLYYAFSDNWPTPPHYLCGRQIVVWGNNADPDGDGISNDQEYIRGTDPNSYDPESGLTVTSNSVEILVTFTANAASGIGYTGLTRRFDLLSTTNLSSGQWTGVLNYTNIAGGNQLVTYTNSTGNNTYYKLQIRLE